MKNQKHYLRIVAVMIALICLLPVIPANAATKTSVTVESLNANPGETINVKVNAGKSDGIVGFGVGIDYDPSVFTYVNIVYLPDYTGKSNKYSSTNVTGKCGYPLLAQCTFDPTVESGVKNECTLFVLTFKIADNAKDGYYKITPSVTTANKTGCIYGWDTATNKQLDYTANCSAGTITIGNPKEEPSDVTSEPIIDPGKTSEKASDVTSEKTSDPVIDPGKTSEKTSDVTSEKTSDVTSEKTSDVTSEKTSDVTSGKTSEGVTSEVTSGEVTSEVTSEQTSGSTSDVTSGATSGQTSGDVTSENTSGSGEKDDPTDPAPKDKPQKSALKTVLLVAGIVLLAAAAGFGIWKLIPILKNKKDNRE